MFQGDIGGSEHWSNEVSAAYATPCYAAIDHSQQDAPVHPRAWLLEYPLEQLVGAVSGSTSVTPDWTDNTGQPSQNASLLTADGFVPQFPPCVASGPVAGPEFHPGTEPVTYDLAGQIFSDYGGQVEWQHCAPPMGNFD
ncbi:hypothetical protein JB92DRAFT_3132288 [Gautieria morchelliformis]|nr:hypothetical protein JB92DRAFT_3132288 [Gautieria morchelliformis]